MVRVKVQTTLAFVILGFLVNIECYVHHRTPVTRWTDYPTERPIIGMTETYNILLLQLKVTPATNFDCFSPTIF